LLLFFGLVAVITVGLFLGPAFVARFGVLVAVIWIFLWGALALLLGGPEMPASGYLAMVGYAMGGAIAIVLFSFALAWVFDGATAGTRLRRR